MVFVFQLTATILTFEFQYTQRNENVLTRNVFLNIYLHMNEFSFESKTNKNKTKKKKKQNPKNQKKKLFKQKITTTIKFNKK